MFEEAPKPTPARSLEEMSLEELAKHIVKLQDEIVRCEAEIKKKEAVKKAADNIFGG